MVDLKNTATLFLRYEGVDYPVSGYFMPNAILGRRERDPSTLREMDRVHGETIQKSVLNLLEHIYKTVILPGDIKALAKLGETKRRPDFVNITRMFG